MDQGETQNSVARFCKNCGNPVKPDINFCSKCGTQIRETDETKVSPPSQVIQSPSYITDPNQGFQTTDPGGFPGQYPPNYVPPEIPKDFITPREINEVREPLFPNNEIRLVLLMGLMGYFSHLLRYLLIYNRFPGLIDLILPLPVYLLIVIILTGADKKIFQQKGVNHIIHADTFDYTVSLVLSSFFLTSLNFRTTIDKETSTVPKNVYIMENTKMGLNYQQVPSAVYIGQYVRPKTLFKSTFIALALGAVFLWAYFYTNDVNLTILTRLVAAYLGGLALTNVSPRFGRYNEEMSAVGKYRTLLLFLLSFGITMAAILGESFFVALR
ncbi:MAG: zinc ribbon domain-containing protein [Candidatus Heimdallarchaeota archaeon]|nr:zinc ribbon domain-containing protein [Candidatus Heimdallarchaeota archaeon]